MSYFKVALIASVGLIADTHSFALSKADSAKAKNSTAPAIEKSETNFFNPNECCSCEGVLKVVTSTDYSFAQSKSANRWR